MDSSPPPGIRRPYLRHATKGYYIDLTPSTDRPGLFPEDIDERSLAVPQHPLVREAR